MVGNRCRVRREESDCFCIELRVCDVSRDVEEGTRVIEERVEGEFEFEFVGEGFNRATRCAVTGSNAEICMGGRVMGERGFL